MMVQTIHMIDTLPDRIEKLETYVHELSNKFSRHEGSQEQGIKRISDRITSINDAFKLLHTSSEKEIRGLNDEIITLGKIEGLTDDQKELISDIKGIVDLLKSDYDSRQKVKKTIWYYWVCIVEYFLKYAMLPVTIALLIFFGFSPNMVPGYDPSKIVAHSSQFNKASVELLTIARGNSISESELGLWMNGYTNKLITIYRTKNISLAIQSNYRHQDKHFFVWLPDDHDDGYVQIFGENGVLVGEKISIVRDQ